jgi:hypothetical protein
MMRPLVHTIEAQFHGAANAQVLRELHERGDWNGLLEYALLLAEQEASQRSQIKWLAGEAMRSCSVEPWHLAAANELLAGGH